MMLVQAIKALALILWMSACYAVIWVFFKLDKISYRDAVVHAAHIGILRIVGGRVHVHGQMSDNRPLLLMANHISYLDVVALGCVFPVRFTPKLEISKWPGISALCNAIGCIYVERKASGLEQAMERIKQALARREVVCVFPESTTGNGVRLLPFKSSLFQVAEDTLGQQNIAVQPVSIAYTHIRKLPIDTGQWPSIAWYGDMDFMPHLWALLRLGRIDISVTFLPATTLKEKGDRKKLAHYCHATIADSIHHARQKVVGGRA